MVLYARLRISTKSMPPDFLMNISTPMPSWKQRSFCYKFQQYPIVMELKGENKPQRGVPEFGAGEKERSAERQEIYYKDNSLGSSAGF